MVPSTMSASVGVPSSVSTATARSNVTAASTVSPLVYAPSAPGSETTAGRHHRAFGPAPPACPFADCALLGRLAGERVTVRLVAGRPVAPPRRALGVQAST